MQMQHHFTVPVPIDVAWDALLDPERVAPCMPGASLTKVEGDEFTGSVKVKLGPISLQYKGSGAFTTVDAEARRVVIDASGKDARGNGTAAASVTAVLTEDTGSESGASAGASTSVRVDTDLKVTGKPAQMGRGLISDVAGKILDQFADCLSQRLAGASESSATPEPTSSAEAASGAGTASAESTGTGASGGESGVGQSGAGRPSPESSGGAANPAHANGQRAAGSGRSGTAAAPVGKAPGWRMAPPGSGSANDGGASEEAIDLLGTAGAPVLKRVAPVVLVLAAVGLGVLVLRRKRRQ